MASAFDKVMVDVVGAAVNDGLVERTQLPDAHLLGALRTNGDFTLIQNDQEILRPGDLLVAARVID